MKTEPKVPKDLYDLQSWFGNIIREPIRRTGSFSLPLIDEDVMAEVAGKIKQGPKPSAHQCIAIYNQQYRFRLLSILHEGFFLLTRLFGYKDFNERIAEPYLLRSPPAHWSLATLGADIPEWLEKEYHEKDRRLVLSSAKIDVAYERVFFAESRPFIHMEMQEMSTSLLLFLQPSVLALKFGCDLFRYRDALLEHEVEYWAKHDFPELKWDRDHYFVLFRSSDGILYEEISNPEYLLLSTFQKGATLEQACSRLEGKREIEEKIGTWFQHWTNRGWLSLGLQGTREC